MYLYNHQLDQEEKEFSDNLKSALNINEKCSLTSEQIEQLKAFIKSNRKCFGSHHIPLRTTTLATHRINTGTHPPISVPPYRVGPAQQEEIAGRTEQMLENHIIQVSDSSYASPVLFS